MDRRLATLVVIAILLAGTGGCERELLPLDPSHIITGYEVRGVVSDRFGNPIAGVEVSVDYVLEFADDGPEPPRTYQVPPPGDTLTVSVIGRDGRTVLTLPQGPVPPGGFTYRWDGRTASGQPVLPGIYSVRYLSGGVVRNTFPVLVTGTTATVTDTVGRYVIRDRELPIGFYPVPDYSLSGTTYYGNLRITPEVVLGFTIGGLSDYRSVHLQEDRVIIFDTRLD